MNMWQLMDSAPYDGTSITILMDDNTERRVHWSKNYKDWYSEEYPKGQQILNECALKWRIAENTK